MHIHFFIPFMLKNHTSCPVSCIVGGWGSWGWGVYSSEMGGGGAHWMFSKKPLMGTNILFCGCGLNFFSSPRGANSKTAHYLLSYFLGLYTLKGTTKAHLVNLLRLNTLRGTKTAFVTRKRYEEGTHPLYVMIN